MTPGRFKCTIPLSAAAMLLFAWLAAATICTPTLTFTDWAHEGTPAIGTVFNTILVITGGVLPSSPDDFSFADIPGAGPPRWHPAGISMHGFVWKARLAVWAERIGDFPDVAAVYLPSASAIPAPRGGIQPREGLTAPLWAGPPPHSYGSRLADVFALAALTIPFLCVACELPRLRRHRRIVRSEEPAALAAALCALVPGVTNLRQLAALKRQTAAGPLLGELARLVERARFAPDPPPDFAGMKRLALIAGDLLCGTRRSYAL